MTSTDGGVQWGLKPGPRPTQGAQAGTNGNGAKDRTKDKLQHMYKSLAQETSYYSVDPRLIQEAGPETELEAGTTKMQFKQELNAQESPNWGQGM